MKKVTFNTDNNESDSDDDVLSIRQTQINNELNFYKSTKDKQTPKEEDEGEDKQEDEGEEKEDEGEEKEEEDEGEKEKEEEKEDEGEKKEEDEKKEEEKEDEKKEEEKEDEKKEEEKEDEGEKKEDVVSVVNVVENRDVKSILKRNNKWKVTELLYDNINEYEMMLIMESLWVKGYLGTYVKVKGMKGKEYKLCHEKDVIFKDGVKYNLVNMNYYELLSREDVSVTIRKNDVYVVSNQGDEYVMNVVYKIKENGVVIVEYKHNMLEQERLWRYINSIGKDDYMKEIKDIELSDKNYTYIVSVFKNMCKEWLKRFDNKVVLDELIDCLLKGNIEKSFTLSELVEKIVYIKLYLMSGKIDYYNFSVDKICELDYDENSDEEINIDDDYDKFMDDFFDMIYNVKSTSELKNMDFVNINNLNIFLIRHYDIIYDMDNSDKYIEEIRNGNYKVVQKLIEYFGVNDDFFSSDVNNYIMLNDNIFDIKVLKDQFNLGIYTNYYTGEQFNSKFISNIISKNIKNINKVEIVLKQDNSNNVYIMDLFKAYINARLFEESTNVYSNKFFEKGNESVDTVDEKIYKENIVESVKEKIKEIKEVISNKLKTVKYNKSKKVYDIVEYDSVDVFDKDSNWPNPRVSRNNEIKSS